MKDEALFLAVKDGITENICREQITRELDALEAECE